MHARQHARIAERAGVSRPTVYKYVGDQDAIWAAILDREFDRFVELLLPVLTSSDDLQHHLVDGLVAVVEYARQHPLLEVGLRDHPEIVLPALTTRSGPWLERSVDYFGEQLERALALAGATDLSARTVIEWFFRIAASLIAQPTHLDPAANGRGSTRRSVEDLVRLMGLYQGDR